MINRKFEVVKTFIDSSHLVRNIVKCKDCGQLYFHEYYEVIDWVDGDDSQYDTYIPIEDEIKAEALSSLSPLELLGNSPRLQWDYVKGVTTVRWI